MRLPKLLARSWKRTRIRIIMCTLLGLTAKMQSKVHFAQCTSQECDNKHRKWKRLKHNPFFEYNLCLRIHPCHAEDISEIYITRPKTQSQNSTNMPKILHVWTRKIICQTVFFRKHGCSKLHTYASRVSKAPQYEAFHMHNAVSRNIRRKAPNFDAFSKVF